MSLGLIGAAGIAYAASQSRKQKDGPDGSAHGIGTWEPKGETPVSRLAALLLDELQPGPKAALWEKVDRLALRGAPAARLEEWLYEHADPARVLAGSFAPFELAVVARKRFEMELPSNLDGAAMARRILCRLGFDARGEPVGLHPALRQAGALRSALDEGRTTPRAIGGELGPTIERVGKELLSFHLRMAFASARDPGSLLARVAVGVHEGPFGGMTIGGIRSAIQGFETWRTTGAERDARARHEGVYGTRSLAIDALDRLGEDRNPLAHHRPDQCSPEALDAAARDLLDASHAWFTWLRQDSEGPRLFPAIVRIGRVERDDRGPLVQAVDDEGKPEEIRPADDVKVGTYWFMVPRSNPVRVRPLLVPVD